MFCAYLWVYHPNISKKGQTIHLDLSFSIARKKSGILHYLRIQLHSVMAIPVRSKLISCFFGQGRG